MILSHRRRLPLLLLLAGTATVAVSACGPTVPFRADMRENASKLAYGGAQVAATPVPRPPVESVPLAFPGAVLPPQVIYTVPGFSPPPTTLAPAAPPTPPPCAPLPAGAVPHPEASSATLGYPAEASYTYRQTGTVTDGTHPATALDPTVVEHVSGGADKPGAVAGSPTRIFGVTEQQSGMSLIVDYEVNEKDPLTPGLRITGLKATSNGQTDFSFVPAEPARIFTLPAIGEAGTGEDDRQVDPLSGVAVDYIHVTTGREVVNACGTPLQAWAVTFNAASSIKDPRSNRYFSLAGQMWVAPQYGCLVVAENLTVVATDAAGNELAGGYKLVMQRTIDQVPADPVP
jgi:hypothetical protein